MIFNFTRGVISSGHSLTHAKPSQTTCESDSSKFLQLVSVKYINYVHFISGGHPSLSTSEGRSGSKNLSDKKPALMPTTTSAQIGTHYTSVYYS